jgi:hypothetical protein
MINGEKHWKRWLEESGPESIEERFQKGGYLCDAVLHPVGLEDRTVMVPVVFVDRKPPHKIWFQGQIYVTTERPGKSDGYWHYRHSGGAVFYTP